MGEGVEGGWVWGWREAGCGGGGSLGEGVEGGWVRGRALNGEGGGG